MGWNHVEQTICTMCCCICLVHVSPLQIRCVCVCVCVCEEVVPNALPGRPEKQSNNVSKSFDPSAVRSLPNKPPTSSNQMEQQVPPRPPYCRCYHVSSHVLCVFTSHCTFSSMFLPQEGRVNHASQSSTITIKPLL